MTKNNGHNRNASQPVIETYNLWKSLPIANHQLDILKGINIAITSGEMVAIVGPSGSGKSTLMGLIGGLDSATSGQILIDGEDITKVSERKLTRIRNQKIGFVFQYFNLVPTLDALENVMLPMQFSPFNRLRSGRNYKERGENLLNMLKLEERIHHTAKQLSGGEQQRVSIARALANEPSILLCDEPTGNLDTASSGVVLDALFDVRQRTGTTVVIVTHDMTIAEQTDRIIELVDGKIV